MLARGGLRSLRSPASFRSSYTGEPMPSAYSQLRSTVPEDGNDHGHTHDNSTIVSHAFYLMTKGARNPTSNLEVVDNVDWDAAIALWFRTIYTLDARYADRFLHFARLDTNVAFFSFDRRVLTAAACAWRAVQVFTDADLNLLHRTVRTTAPGTGTSPSAASRSPPQRRSARAGRRSASRSAPTPLSAASPSRLAIRRRPWAPTVRWRASEGARPRTIEVSVVRTEDTTRAARGRRADRSSSRRLIPRS